MLESLLYYVLAAGSFSTLLFFVFKTIVNRSFDFALEKYKSEVTKEVESHKQKLQFDIEQFKGELNLISIEHNISFGKLQEERATVIKTTYLKLVELSKQLQILTSMFQGPDWHANRENDKAAEVALNDFKEYFAKNRIFLPKSVCERLLTIIKESWSVIVDMSLTKDEAGRGFNNMGGKTSLDLWRELNKKVTSEMADAMSELEDIFRKLLGDK